jgi:glycosyltransferase involved in cell wall biosynthesis
MKIWVFTVCHNEAAIAPWFLRHYGEFADRILVWDDNSTDGTREILRAHPSVTLFDWPYRTGLFEDVNLHHAYDVYPSARGKADWCMWVDMDEFVYSPDMFAALKNHAYGVSGPYAVDVINCKGFNMSGNGLPVNGYEHKQIWEHMPMGVAAPNYDKPIVFNPRAKVRWIRGKHRLESFDNAPLPFGCNRAPLFKILHYRYLGAEYTRQKNAKNFNRCGGDTGDKAAAWTCRPDFDGPTLEGSPQWAATLPGLSFNVIDAPL